MHPYLLEFQLPHLFKLVFGVVPLMMHFVFIAGGVALMFFPDSAVGKTPAEGQAAGKPSGPGGPSTLTYIAFWAGLGLLVFGMIGVGVSTLSNDDEQEKAHKALVSVLIDGPKLEVMVGEYAESGTFGAAKHAATGRMVAELKTVTTPSNATDNDTWAYRKADKLTHAIDDLRTAATADPPPTPERRAELVGAVKTAYAEASQPMTIGDFPLRTVKVPSYGVMIMLGFISCILVAYFRSRSYGIDPNVVIDLGIICMLAGIIGARVWHVVEYWNEAYVVDQMTGATRGTFEALGEAMQVQKGGLVFYGGFIGAAICVWGYLYVRKLPVLFYVDIAAILVPLGQAFGRIGCFLNGCCWGVSCDPSHPLATAYGNSLSLQTTAPDGTIAYEVIHRAGDPVIASQFVASILAIMLFLLLTVYYEKFAKRRGETMALLFAFYGVNRFFNQMLRADVPVYTEAGLSSSQWFSILSFAFGMALWVYFRFVRTHTLPPRYDGIKLEQQGIYRMNPA